MELTSVQCSFILSGRDCFVCPLQATEGHSEQVMAYMTWAEVQVNESQMLSSVLIWSSDHMVHKFKCDHSSYLLPGKHCFM